MHVSWSQHGPRHAAPTQRTGVRSARAHSCTVLCSMCCIRAMHVARRSQITVHTAARGRPPPTRAAPISVQSGGGGGACGRATDRLRSTATLDRLRTHTIGPLQL